MPLCDCGKFCPAPVKICLPTTWTKIQDWTHCSLIFGFGFGVVILLWAAIVLFQGSCWERGCASQLVAIIFIGPVIMYTLQLIGQYDDRLYNCKAEVGQAKKALSEAYCNLITDMESFLSRAAESSAGLAERSFEAKRRDFLRFLDRCQSKYERMFDGSKGDKQQLLEQFRKFVRQWLAIFRECSVDPVNFPKIIVTEEELVCCRDFVQICDLIRDRLRNAEVKFYTIHREHDVKELERYKKRTSTLAVEDKREVDPEKGVLATVNVGDGSDGSVRAMCTQKQISSALLQTTLDQGEDDLESATCPCNWLQCGTGTGCLCCESPEVTGEERKTDFPRVSNCFCVRFTVLSREHVMLLIGFAMTWLVFVLELVNVEKVNPMFEALVVAYALSMLALIIQFQRVDVLLRLERELKNMKEEHDSVEATKEQMAEFWGGVHELTEFWLHRTVPRLDLAKEIHGQLEDASREQLIDLMTTANDCLGRLDQEAGKLEDWRQGGALNSAAKKKFGENVILVGNCSRLPQLLGELDHGLKKGAFNAELLAKEPSRMAIAEAEVPSHLKKKDEKFQGWMMKRGPRTKDAWKLRFCRLQGRRFSYYTAEDFASIKGEFKICSGEDARTFGSNMASSEARELALSRPYGIEIVAQDRTYLFDARDQSTQEKWLTMLKRIGFSV